MCLSGNYVNNFILTIDILKIRAKLSFINSIDKNLIKRIDKRKRGFMTTFLKRVLLEELTKDQINLVQVTRLIRLIDKIQSTKIN